MDDTKHLWEVDHSYYCSESNYFSNESPRHFKSWAEFAEEFSDSDMDMNLVFRWDWLEGADWDLAEYNGDDNYRNGQLRVFFVGQRKGLFWCAIIEVCRADEPSVVAFLKPRFSHLLEMWLPLQ